MIRGWGGFLNRGDERQLETRLKADHGGFFDLRSSDIYDVIKTSGQPVI
jgi:hypothetical protein